MKFDNDDEKFRSEIWIKESIIDRLINWAQNTEMEQISIGMLLDWFIELKNEEINKN